MKTTLPAALAVVLLALLAPACGRSQIFEPTPVPGACRLHLQPASIAFGSVALGAAVTSRLLLSNVGGAPCQIGEVALGDPSDADFSLPMAQATTLTLAPGSDASLSVDFDAASPSPPTAHQGTLTFATNDPDQPSVAVPLSANIVTVCRLSIAPSSLDFGHVAIGTSVTQAITVSNSGSAPCAISAIGIAAGSDAEFSIASGQTQPLAIDPGGSAPVSVTFAATDRATPHQKLGTLVLQTNDPRSFSSSVPLTATIDIGCDLAFAPAQLSFGNVVLNTSLTEQVTLSNDGSATCNVSGVALGGGTDPTFSLPTQPLAFPVTPGGSATIAVAFSADDSAPPHQRTGTLAFQTDNAASPSASVPLSAFINTVCSEASQWIYTVDGSDNMLSRFDPTTLTFTDIGVLTCPAGGASPFDMAVDQNAVAWVLYDDGQLFQVDTTSAACQATTFNQPSFIQFGMGFVFDPSTGLDTLYISGSQVQAPTPEPLATVAFPSLAVTEVGTVSIGFADLTGTGDGELWGFAPPTDSVTGSSLLAQLDPASGATLASFPLPALDSAFNADWAMKFWGGSFWIFIGSSVYAVDRTSGRLSEPLPNGGSRDIVGAGVSTCAPVQ